MPSLKLGRASAAAFASLALILFHSTSTLAFPQVAPGVPSGEGQITGPASTPE